MTGTNDTVGSAVSTLAAKKKKKVLTKQKIVEFVILKYLSRAITLNNGSGVASSVEMWVNI